MELEAEDGSVIFIERGFKKELGRGPGIAADDRTVSRRQVLLELPDSKLKNESIGSGSDVNRLYLQVLGPNPVCIIRNRQDGSTFRQELAKPEDAAVIFLKKGEKSWLSEGDQISVSIRHPVFFTYKESHRRTGEEVMRLIERTGSTAGEFIVNKSVEACKDKNGIRIEEVKVGNEDSQGDLLTKWRERKKCKGMVKEPDEPMKLMVKEPDEPMSKVFLKDDGMGTLKQNDKELAAKEEEEGIAEAVARRQKRAAERYQQQQFNQNYEYKEGNQEQNLTRQILPDGNYGGIQTEFDHTLRDSQHIDPVKEFGFLLEGAEFEQYDKHRRYNIGKWDWSIGRTENDEGDKDQEEDQEVEPHQHITGRRKSRNPEKAGTKGKAKEDDDDEWMGENEEEKLKIEKVQVPKKTKKLCLRSRDPTSSTLTTTPTQSRKNQHNLVNAGDSEEEDIEDETLGGFIVDDEEEEFNEELEDEEDWSVNNEIEEEDDNDDDDVKAVGGKLKGKQKKGQKPLCKYGKSCFRKNKEHLECYQHPS